LYVQKAEALPHLGRASFPVFRLGDAFEISLDVSEQKAQHDDTGAIAIAIAAADQNGRASQARG
jgi:hypothetical protein